MAGHHDRHQPANQLPDTALRVLAVLSSWGSPERGHNGPYLCRRYSLYWDTGRRRHPDMVSPVIGDMAAVSVVLGPMPIADFYCKMHQVQAAGHILPVWLTRV